MGAKNTSDSIEAYIKSILAQAGMVELKRSELADVFQVVPSQLSFRTVFQVWKSWFTNHCTAFIVLIDDVVQLCQFIFNKLLIQFFV